MGYELRLSVSNEQVYLWIMSSDSVGYMPCLSLGNELRQSLCLTLHVNYELCLWVMSLECLWIMTLALWGMSLDLCGI